MTDDSSPHPLYFTLGEAAKRANVSKPTLSKAVKTGRITAEKQPDGSYRIQPVELFRVYPPATHETRSSRSDIVTHETGNDNRLLTEQLTHLGERLAMLTVERDRERNTLTDEIADLRRRLDAEGEERRKLTAILTDQRPPAAQSATGPAEKPAPGFFSRLLSGTGKS